MVFNRHTLRSAASTVGHIECKRLLGIDGVLSQDGASFSRADCESYFDGSEKPGTINFIRTGFGEIGKRPGFIRVADNRYCPEIDRVYKYENFGEEIYLYMNEHLAVRSDNDWYFLLPPNFSDCNAFSAGEHIVFMKNHTAMACQIRGLTSCVSDIPEDDTLNDNNFFFTPTIIIGGKPDGSGQAYQAYNILNPYVCELYAGDGESKEFILHNKIDRFCRAFSLGPTGNQYEIEDFSFSGNKVTFAAAPEKPALTGEDNIMFVYRKQGLHSDFRKFTTNNICTRYGVNGALNRVFVASQNTNRIYFSEANELLYFPDINYINIGTSTTRIYGILGDSDKLSVICNDGIYFVKGYEYDNENTPYYESALFKIVDYVKTPTPVRCEPIIFDNEVLYLTVDGVCAITTSGVLDERCAQIRSSFINKFLLKERLWECTLGRYGDFLTIYNGKDTLYLLDGKQFTISDEKPFSLRQYEGYIWNGIKANWLWTPSGKEIMFTDGKNVMKLSDGTNNAEYSDDRVDENGQVFRSAFNAYWETPYIRCGDVAKNKYFTKLGLMLESKIGGDGSVFNTDIRVYAKIDGGDWELVKDYDGKRSIFRYDTVSYSRFVYSDKPKTYITYEKIGHKKGKSIKLRFENNNPNEPVIIQGFDLEYIQT